VLGVGDLECGEIAAEWGRWGAAAGLDVDGFEAQFI
jgi:hypothetical protein